MPTSVSGTSGNGSVSLTWSAPSSVGGSGILDYVIEYSSNSGATWATFADATSSATSATVTGLTNGTSYVFQVSASNNVGTGQQSAVSSGVIPATVPGAPTGVSGVGGAGQATVSWTAPVVNGGASISSYTVTSSGGQSCGWSSGPLSCVVTGLGNGVAYTFTVTASNSAGEGVASSASSSVTPLAAAPVLGTFLQVMVKSLSLGELFLMVVIRIACIGVPTQRGRAHTRTRVLVGQRRIRRLV